MYVYSSYLAGPGFVDTSCNHRSLKLCSMCQPDYNSSITGLQDKIFKSKIVNIFSPISFNIYFGCSKEPYDIDGSFEYP